MDRLKELRRQIGVLEKATNEPFKYNPEHYNSFELQRDFYERDVDKLSEAKKEFFALLQEGKKTKKQLS